MAFAQDYFDRPWLWAANQTGHFTLGFIMTSVLLWAVYVFLGEYLNQLAAGITVVLFYFAVIEIAAQGWRGLDTILDTYFVALGAVPPFILMEMQQIIHKLVMAELFFMASLGIGFFILQRRRAGD